MRGVFCIRNAISELTANLGLLWEEREGLPLPLGAIAGRRDLSDEMQERFQRGLRRSLEYAFAHPLESRQFVKMHARDG